MGQSVGRVSGTKDDLLADGAERILRSGTSRGKISAVYLIPANWPWPVAEARPG
jgi:hypothetical protein